MNEKQISAMDLQGKGRQPIYRLTILSGDGTCEIEMLSEDLSEVQGICDDCDEAGKAFVIEVVA